MVWIFFDRIINTVYEKVFANGYYLGRKQESIRLAGKEEEYAVREYKRD